MTDDADWNLYRTFLAVARSGSFSAAARAMGSTQPTVGRQIDMLEALLGSKLFVRSPRGLAQTQSARSLVPYAEAMASAAEALGRAASGDAGEDVGAVRLTANEVVGQEVVPSILADFGFVHPRIEIELLLSNRNEDLLRRDADVAIRMVRPTQQDIVARKLGVMTSGLFAHTRYVEVFGLPAEPADISAHRLIGFDKDMHLLQSGGVFATALRRSDFSIRTDSVAAQLAAVRAGLGIGACPLKVAARDANLVPVLAGHITFRREVWLAMHASAKTTRRIRLLYDHLAIGLRHWLEAVSPPGRVSKVAQRGLS